MTISGFPTGDCTHRPSLALAGLAPSAGGPAVAPYRSWEDLYRRTWRWDAIVKGTCNRADCIAACSLNLYVKDGMVWREEQNTVYEQTNESLPDFNPRGCQKGMCYSDLMYEPSRIKYPMRRVGPRGSGKWERISWDEALTTISDAVLDAVTEDGPETVIYDHGTTNIDFGPHTPAEMNLSRIIGTTALDEWASVGDLAMGAIQTFGLLNADGTSDDWFNSDYIVVWLGNPVYTRVPDVHFMFEARYRGAKVVVIAPDYNATSIHSDLWLNVRTGTDAALALGAARIMIEEGLYKPDYVKEQTDLPFLVRDDNRLFLRQSDMEDGGGEEIFFVWDSRTGAPAQAPGSLGDSNASIALGDLDPALEGRWQVTLKDGSKVTVRTVFSLLRERLADYTPERVAEITGVSPRVLARFAHEFAGADASMIFASWGACKHYHQDLFQRGMILMLALGGHTGKPGGGIRIGAWWNMALTYDPAVYESFTKPEQRPKVRDVERIMKNVMRMSTTTPTMMWLYAHDEGYRNIVNNNAFHDPAIPRPVAEYCQEAMEKGWMPVWPKPPKHPRVFLFSGMNPLRRWPVPQVLRQNMWEKFDLIVTWDFRMSSSGMQCDMILPAAGWHEKEGVKFTQSLVPYICVGDKAVDPMFDSKAEWEIMGLLARNLERRAKEREVPPIVDSFGQERDLKQAFNDWSCSGIYTENDAARAMDFGIQMSEPTKGIPWAEAAKMGAIRVKDPGEYGIITGMCTDYKLDRAFYPYGWFVEGKESWPTLTGRQQFYLDHPWFLEVGEELPVHKENPRLGGDYPLLMTGGHTRWSIHAIWRANRTLLRLQRGEPVAYISQQDARQRGIKDHDLITVRNDVGGFTLRAKVSPQVQPGQLITYHAWEPYQFPGWQSNQAVVASPFKPLHMVGNYGHLQYRFALGQPSQAPRAHAVEMERVPEQG